MKRGTYTRTEEIRKKLSEAQKNRYANETTETKEKRANNIRAYHEKVRALMDAEVERKMMQSHIDFVTTEYNKLKEQGLI